MFPALRALRYCDALFVDTIRNKLRYFLLYFIVSNKYNTYANSEGVYKIAERYRGSWSPAYRLDGLDKTNSNARGRAIVLHEADYVTKKRAGYSQGCIVVYRGFVKGTLVPLISKADSAWLIVKNGTLPVKH